MFEITRSKQNEPDAPCFLKAHIYKRAPSEIDLIVTHITV